MNHFIRTEIYNCGKIGQVALHSFQKHHPNLKVHVFGFEKDFEAFDESENITPVILNTNDWLDEMVRLLGEKFENKLFDLRLSRRSISKGFEDGHLGTARLWAHINQRNNDVTHVGS